MMSLSDAAKVIVMFEHDQLNCKVISNTQTAHFEYCGTDEHRDVLEVHFAAGFQFLFHFASLTETR